MCCLSAAPLFAASESSRTTSTTHKSPHVSACLLPVVYLTVFNSRQSLCSYLLIPTQQFISFSLHSRSNWRCSLVQHLLRRFLKFTATLVNHLLLSLLFLYDRGRCTSVWWSHSGALLHICSELVRVVTNSLSLYSTTESLVQSWTCILLSGTNDRGLPTRHFNFLFFILRLFPDHIKHRVF